MHNFKLLCFMTAERNKGCQTVSFYCQTVTSHLALASPAPEQVTWQLAENCMSSAGHSPMSPASSFSPLPADCTQSPPLLPALLLLHLRKEFPSAELTRGLETKTNQSCHHQQRDQEPERQPSLFSLHLPPQPLGAGSEASPRQWAIITTARRRAAQQGGGKHLLTWKRRDASPSGCWFQ